MILTLAFNVAAFVGITLALVLAIVRPGVIDTRTEQGRALAVGLVAMWLTGIVGLLRRFHSPLADDAALVAWVAWAVIAWWLVALHARKH